MLDRIADLTRRQTAGLARLAEHPRLANTRQLGSVIALDVVVEDGGYMSELAPRLKADFTARNVLLRPLGNTVYVMPPYCIDDADLGAVHNAIIEVVDLL